MGTHLPSSIMRVLFLERMFLLFRRLEDQPRASDTLDALATSVVSLTGHDVHQAILLSGKGLQRPGQVLTVQDEDYPVLLSYLLQGTLTRFLVGDGFGQKLLPFGRLGPQLLPMSHDFCLASPVLLAPPFYVVLDPVQDPLD